MKGGGGVREITKFTHLGSTLTAVSSDQAHFADRLKKGRSFGILNKNRRFLDYPWNSLFSTEKTDKSRSLQLTNRKSTRTELKRLHRDMNDILKRAFIWNPQGSRCMCLLGHMRIIQGASVKNLVRSQTLKENTTRSFSQNMASSQTLKENI